MKSNINNIISAKKNISYVVDWNAQPPRSFACTLKRKFNTTGSQSLEVVTPRVGEKWDQFPFKTERGPNRLTPGRESNTLADSDIERSSLFTAFEIAARDSAQQFSQCRFHRPLIWRGLFCDSRCAGGVNSSSQQKRRPLKEHAAANPVYCPELSLAHSWLSTHWICNGNSRHRQLIVLNLHIIK
jgi:hypothetical protein